MGGAPGRVGRSRGPNRESQGVDRGHLIDLIEGNDLDGLVRFVDGLASGRDWDGLVELRDRCNEAVHRGKQLWGAAQYAEYRLALEAPGALAAGVVVEGAGRFSLGPLWEVAASSHGWSELAPHLGAGRARTLVAHERVVRGERLSDVAGLDPGVLTVPFALEDWEPTYPVAIYRPDKATFPDPDRPQLEWVELDGTGGRVRDHDDAADHALYELARPWAETSNGRCEVVAVDGDAMSAIQALAPGKVGLARVDLATALAVMAWTGASGGAYGRRRGTAVGRATAWWVLTTLAGFEDAPSPKELGVAARELRWYLWDPGDRTSGWLFHLAVEDPVDGISWAVAAVDET